MKDRAFIYLRFLKLESYGSFIDFLVGCLAVLPASAYLSNFALVASIFVSFTVLLYPGIYAFNHVIDLPFDQHHPSKSNRPITSGVVSPHIGMIISGTFILSGLILGYYISYKVFIFELVFIGFNVVYTVAIKHIPYIEILWVTMTHPMRTVFAICIFGQLEKKLWPFLAIVALVWFEFNILKRYKELDELGDTVRRSLKYYSKAILLRLIFWSSIALVTVFFFCKSLQMLLIISLGAVYYIILLLVYFKGNGKLKQLINYMLTQ